VASSPVLIRASLTPLSIIIYILIQNSTSDIGIYKMADNL
jgi:hypothetical protein